MLNTETYTWEAWDGNASRNGAAMHVVAAKLFLSGGVEGAERFADVIQFNFGNFMIEFDGVDDEIMIPHLPTIIPNAYTIEAWVRPATVKAMNIIVRTNETYPQSAWSHQLRINAEGAPLHVAPLSAPLLLILGRLDGAPCTLMRPSLSACRSIRALRRD